MLSDDGFTPWALQISVAFHQLFVRARAFVFWTWLFNGFLIKLGAAASGARPAGTTHYTQSKRSLVEVFLFVVCCVFLSTSVRGHTPPKRRFFVNTQKMALSAMPMGGIAVLHEFFMPAAAASCTCYFDVFKHAKYI